MTILLPIHKIKPPPWMLDTDLIRVLDSLNHDDIHARMVGGCIRNHYTNKNVYDIDIACKFNPNESKEILENNGIRVIPTGIDHGTITAHINGKNFEITTLRRDVATDGRHAKIEFSDSWVDDAQRRDFTINALYADRDGSIYDPLGTGFADLQNHIVRFIGNASNRIQEDYLRILRFFRFYADYHGGDPDRDAIDACTKFKDKIDTLSDERICDELFKTLKSNNAHRAVKAMSDIGLFDLNNNNSDKIKMLITLQNQLNHVDIPTRYEISIKYKKCIKNNKINKFINRLNSFKNNWDGDIKKSLYAYDRDVVIQGLLTLKSEGHDIHDLAISDAMTLPVPQLPIVASDIMMHFKITEGPEVGDKMKAAEQIWTDSHFTLKRDEILEKI